MNRLQVSKLVALAVLVTSAGKAETISIGWTSVDQTVPVGYGPYLPRVASDWVYGSMIMLQAGPGFTTILYQTGNAKPAPGPLTSVDWCCYPGNNMNNEVGHATSVGLANATRLNGPTFDTALEVHQGGQDGGSRLSYSIGSAKLSSSQKIPANVSWAPSQSYDTGFNATVGVDNSQYLGNPVNAPVVEVHQAGSASPTFGIISGCSWGLIARHRQWLGSPQRMSNTPHPTRPRTYRAACPACRYRMDWPFWCSRETPEICIIRSA